MDKARALQIQNIMDKILDQFHVQFENKEYDQELHDICIRVAQECGISFQGPAHIGLRLSVGVSISSIAHGHIPDIRIRAYIALYTAAVASLEDLCANDADLLSAFCDRFFKSIPHNHPIMDACDILFKQLPLYYDRVPANVILLASMDFIVGCMMEYQIHHNPMSSRAQQFPVFLRNLTGDAKSYAIFAFPPSIPFHSYVETIPLLSTYINFINDIFSFYKEELVNEDVNCISNIARSTGQTKLEALQYLVDETIKAHNEALAVLQDRPDALAAYQAFVRGYIHFHTSAKRYRLVELWEMAAKKEAEEKQQS